MRRREVRASKFLNSITSIRGNSKLGMNNRCKQVQFCFLRHTHQDGIALLHDALKTTLVVEIDGVLGAKPREKAHV